jgi:hypothetical protein
LGAGSQFSAQEDLLGELVALQDDCVGPKKGYNWVGGAKGNTADATIAGKPEFEPEWSLYLTPDGKVLAALPLEKAAAYGFERRPFSFCCCLWHCVLLGWGEGNSKRTTARGAKEFS